MKTPLDVRDQLVQEHVPTVMVPSHSALPGLAAFGHRFLVARDGLWLDVHRPQASLRLQAAPADAPLPYGRVGQTAEFPFGKLSEHLGLLKQFVADAREALPNEFAAVLVWDSFDLELRYVPCKTKSASPARIEYERPAMDENESIAVDLHSHGLIAAGFSTQDDIDDAGEVKIAGVVGNLDQAVPTAAFRICALGLFVNVPVPPEALV